MLETSDLVDDSRTRHDDAQMTPPPPLPSHAAPVWNAETDEIYAATTWIGWERVTVTTVRQCAAAG